MDGVQTLLRVFALFVFSLITLTVGSQANAWGLRGHQVVCEAAIFAVNDDDLSVFLKARVPLVANLCNVPDTSWRSKSPEITAIGGPTHFINTEVVGVPIHEIGTDYRKLQIEFEGKDNKYKVGQKIVSLHPDLGSIWWRVDQFVRRSIDFANIADQAKKPENRGEEQNEKLAFNQALYEWMVNASLLGHFVGDAGQPFHGTSDYDGYSAGHGGIHSFYEEVMVNHQDEKLTQEVINEARRLLKLSETLPKSKRDPKKNTEIAFLLFDNPIEKMRALTEVSVTEVKDILRLDTIKTPSDLTNDKGMEVKVPAQREVTPKLVKSFRRQLVKNMGRSAALLAQFWGHIYARGGRPELKGYKSYRFPFEPEFIPPDYFDLKLEKKAE